jgi:serine/threonine protein kinase
MKFDHLRLSAEHRQLIEAISPADADSVLLEPLDKGLSGASVWLAQWSLTNGTKTSLSVLKINDREKIEREQEAFQRIVSVLDNLVGVFRFHFSGPRSNDLAILNQPFKGNVKTMAVKNLRSRIWDCNSVEDAAAIIDGIYQRRMQNWHPDPGRRRMVETSFREAFDWWMERYQLDSAISQIGSEAIGEDFEYHFGIDTAAVVRAVERIFLEKSGFCYGPIHGDLHAQNILFDEDDRIHLIDFGWTSDRWKAIDFLMLECSLKFLVAPRTARQSDLAVC